MSRQDITKDLPHAMVVVFERNGVTYVNVYGYPNQSEARKHKRRADKEVKEVDSKTKVIAVRVRPIIDDVFLETVNRQYEARTR